MRHSSLEAGDASDLRVVCIGHLARVRSWLTASEVVEAAPAVAEAADVAPRGAKATPIAARTDALQP